MHQHCKIPICFKNLLSVNKFPVKPHTSCNYSKKFPELLYFPQVFRWLNTKVKLHYLKNTWDPDFSEGAFIYGTTTAICKITEIINGNEPEKLKGLLTPEAESQLKKSMELKLTQLQKDIILLKPPDIKLLVPLRVQLVHDRFDGKRCLVLLKSLGMKWLDQKQTTKLVLVVLDTEFKRDYTVGVKPEWIISGFNIIQCGLLGNTK